MDSSKLSTRLAVILGTIILLSVISSLSGLWKMTNMHDQANEVGKNWLPSVDLVHRLNTNTSDFRIMEFRHVLNTEASQMTAIETEMAALDKSIAEGRQRYEALISSPEEKALYDSFSGQWARYRTIHQKLLDISRANQTEQARDLLQGESRQLFDDASADLLKLVELNRNGALASVQAGDEAYALARNVVTGLLVTMVVVSVSAGIWLVRSIMRQLGGDPAVAAEAVNQLASGDLTQPIPLGTDNAASLMHRLLALQQSLQGVVGNVRQNAENVATASAQIAQGNTDLSGRTEEQASALEETSATMEQLNTTVRHNADNAQQANQLAQSASAVAMQGGDVVGQVVQTMKEINASSQKINEIIGVIDGIAFQTNILALNAAVEAARAGEQGRGFAVVAAEVRSLAQRSAEAAKEIKTLIGKSVDQVEHGTVLVDQAGQTMGEIVASIRRVTDIVGEISAASAQQSSGVAQVGEAVSQMDQATQQNAALVEESAAAANSLKHQADQLVSAVAAFKLG